ncbi:hypothetical protein M409DRAFT_50946 [Zasmidium cellare ATCC 36951]|uniref:Uncharacterized protein n=1 Tax=Zasmidium cellare ATCC 36951 TaxID=1080233 RepID=A0A6A6D1J7_ZASCE|nr:uncharacterized protein M409DRAFT_50946 [Zasmidium cellare ATCC 36951]KAF2171516.1 hypothetical protein M409DRAFT_50946 [Zasmidium cellare ATCC 36951]
MPFLSTLDSDHQTAFSGHDVNAKEDTVTLESAPEPSIHQSSGEQIMAMPARFFDELQRATQAHVDLKQFERQVDSLAQNLGRRLEALDEQIPKIQESLTTAKAEGLRSDSEQYIEMQQEIQKRVDEKDEIFGGLEQMQENFREYCQEYRERTEGFFEMWREIANQGLRDMRRDREVVLLPSAFLSMKKKEPPKQVATARPPLAIPQKEPAPRLDAPLAPSDPKRRYLTPDYTKFQRQLDHAYQQLDNRHERFQRDVLDGYQRWRRGEPGCEENRRLTGGTLKRRER